MKDKFSKFRLQYLDEPDKMNELDSLEKMYKKTEYTAMKKHHHNPKTMDKIMKLLDADMEVIKPKTVVPEEEVIQPRKRNNPSPVWSNY